MKVLVVDDSSTMRRILTNCVTEAGYSDILQAADGVEALGMLQQNDDVGLVFADWHMPNMDGFTMLQEIKGSDQTKHIPVIMVTTQAEKQSVMDALKTGASNYIVKPFTPDIIKEKIKEVLG
ncbi:response regulator [bacterium]|nr:response regulator [bacterium]